MKVKANDNKVVLTVETDDLNQTTLGSAFGWMAMGKFIHAQPEYVTMPVKAILTTFSGELSVEIMVQNKDDADAMARFIEASIEETNKVRKHG